jgi:hypothetical protein
MWGGGVVGCSDLDDAWWIERDLGHSFQVYLCIFVQENSQWIIRNPLGTATLVGLQCVWLPSLTFGFMQKSLPGAHTCKSVQIAAKNAEKLRRGPAGLASVEKRGVSNPGGVYGFLNRHSGPMSLLSDEDIGRPSQPFST